LTTVIETFRRAAGGCRAVFVAREEFSAASGSKDMAMEGNFHKFRNGALIDMERNFHKFRYETFSRAGGPRKNSTHRDCRAGGPRKNSTHPTLSGNAARC
jgi:hypothetical protein